MNYISLLIAFAKENALHPFLLIFNSYRSEIT